MLMSRDLPPSLPGQPQGKLLPDSDLDIKTHTAHTKRHQTHWATWKRPLSSLNPVQLMGVSVPRSGLLLPSTMDSGQGSPTALCSPGVLCCPTLLLPGHLGCCALCCLRSVPHTARMAARPPALSEGPLCVSCLQRKKTVFAAEQHSLEPTVEPWRPKATSTPMPPPATQNACLQMLAPSTCTSTRLRGTSVPRLPPYTTTDLSGSCWGLTASGNGPTVFSSVPPISTHAKKLLMSDLDPSCFNLSPLGASVSKQTT